MNATVNELAVNLNPEMLVNEPKRVCFVCTGNTCRSPMAAAVLNEFGGPYHIFGVSAGLYPNIGEPISEKAVKALESAGIMSTSGNNYSAHTACRISESIVNGCDRIIGMSDSHTLTLLQLFPSMASKIYTMPVSISDPYGGSFETYRMCLEQIIKGIREMFHLND